MTPISSAERTAQLLRQTRLHFPQLESEAVEIAPIEKGGSGRKFYRVRSSSAPALILIEYNREREENCHYVPIAEFLTAHTMRAPRIYFHDTTEGLTWIEDLGAADLWSYRNESWSTRRPLYVSALEEGAKLHALPSAAAAMIGPDLQPPFDAPLYLWEQQYFFDHCLGQFFGLDETTRAALAALPILPATAARLASLPRVLVHRDFQSQNIIVREGQAYLIDFQGMRLGLAHYDVASLLYDPYVHLTAAERDELFDSYREIRARAGIPLGAAGVEVMLLCAMQRLMQALGAYGFLGLTKGNKSFLAHIPAALASLGAVLAQIKGAEKLQETLQSLAPSKH